MAKKKVKTSVKMSKKELESIKRMREHTKGLSAKMISQLNGSYFWGEGR